MELRQSTSQIIRFGPFADSTDGVTPETGLTIAQADMQLSKDGAAFAQKNTTGNATHDVDGYYSTTLDTTDTGTAGILKLEVTVAGSVLVWENFEVVTQTYYDAKYTGTFNNLGGVAQTADNNVKISKIPLSDGTNTWNSTALASIKAECDTALGDYDGPTNAEMVARTRLDADYFSWTTDTVANVTTVATTTDLTNLPSIPANWLTSAGISASALDGKGDWNIGKTGYSLTQSFPTNFSDLSIVAGTGLVDITQAAADKAWLTTTRALTDKANFTVDVLKINGVTVVGAGTSGNLWRA